MSVRPVGALAAGIAALALLASCAQPAAQSDTIRAVAAVAPVHHPSSATAAVQHHSIVSTEEHIDQASAAPATPARTDADDHRGDVDHPTAPRTLSPACASALTMVRGLVATDRSEDQSEPATGDVAEDQGEATALQTAIQHAASACLPAQLSRCTLATNALTALNARQAEEDAWEEAHPLPASVAQIEDQFETHILAAAQNAVTTACAA